MWLTHVYRLSLQVRKLKDAAKRASTVDTTDVYSQQVAHYSVEKLLILL